MPYVATKEKLREIEEIIAKVAKDKATTYSKSGRECTDFVKDYTGAQPASLWKRGARVRDLASLTTGTAIATFDEKGKYRSIVGGPSHAAIFVRKDASRIYVYDQYNKASGFIYLRDYTYKGGKGPQNKDGDAFYVIE